MENHPSPAVDDRERPSSIVPWKSFEDRSGSVLVLAGLLMIASVLAPVGLGPVIDRAWASGIVLIGLAVVAVTFGLVGLYLQIRDCAPKLALLGAASAGIAGTAAFTLIVSLGGALFAERALSMTVPRSVSFFNLISLLMAGGFSLGFLFLGVGYWQSGAPARHVGRYLALGGLLLLAPVLVESFGVLFAVSMPPWALFSVLGLVAIDTLAAGYFLHSGRAPD